MDKKDKRFVEETRSRIGFMSVGSLKLLRIVDELDMQLKITQAPAMRKLLERWMKVWREATSIQWHSVDWIQKHNFSEVSADTETFLEEAKVQNG